MEIRRKRGGSMTIARFCRRNHTSRAMFYELRAEGLGPDIMKIGRSVRISYRAERAWIRRMEDGAAANFRSKKDGSEAIRRATHDGDDEDKEEHEG
jgi:hypothetical protein